MKKLIPLILVLIFSFSGLKSQTSLYNALTSYLQNDLKENTKDRLIALNVWSVSDKASRDINVELSKAYTIFEHALLKGGKKGLIGVIYCIDENSVTTNITLTKDGVTKIIAIDHDHSTFSELLKDKNSEYNVVFDSEGNTIYEKLPAGSFFDSIRKLITR
jgi:hypothetical protein